MTQDEREAFEERAAICEFDGKLTRKEAEQMATQEIEQGRKEPGSGQSNV